MPSVTVQPLDAGDATAALKLYNTLTFGPPSSDKMAFEAVIEHDGTTVLGAFDGPALVAMLTLHILPNVTWGGRPYALVENVVTAQSHRRRGIGRQRGAQGFYEAVGFSAEDKAAMVIRRSDTKNERRPGPDPGPPPSDKT